MAGECAGHAIPLRFSDRQRTVVRKSAAPHTPTAIEPYQTRRTRVSAATATSEIAGWNGATLLASR